MTVTFMHGHGSFLQMSNVTQMMKFVFERIENKKHVKKYAGKQHFFKTSIFPSEIPLPKAFFVPYFCLPVFSF